MGPLIEFYFVEGVHPWLLRTVLTAEDAKTLFNQHSATTTQDTILKLHVLALLAVKYATTTFQNFKCCLRGGIQDFLNAAVPTLRLAGVA